MALKFSPVVLDAMLDSITTVIGDSAILKLRSAAAPASCADADTGDVIATLNLPATWMNPSYGGSKTLSGAWADPSADLAGTVEHFRVYATDGVTCHMQGSVTLAIDSGDMILDAVDVPLGGPITITGFTLNAING